MPNTFTKSISTSSNFYQWIPVFFNERTTSRTYFRNCDDTFNSWEWDSYDTEDDTTVGNTISLSAANYLGGFIAPVSCTFTGARWKLYQNYNTSGEAIFQVWTGTSTTATLRTTQTFTSNRAVVTGDSSDVSISLSAGDYVLPGIQYVSGSTTTWYGAVTLKFKEN